MNRQARLLKESFQKFQIDLQGNNVLTEAASGNFICTPLLAAMAGARVFAIAKESKYGSVGQITNEILSLAEELNIEKKVSIVESYDEINLKNIDVVTNTGFVRPIDKNLIEKLKSTCVIPLMWEPWEFRPDELDLDAASKKGIKVYGTNESDNRLQTLRYIGLIVLYFLLREKKTPMHSNILLIGCDKFNRAIMTELKKSGYSVSAFITDKYNKDSVTEYDTIIIAEHIDSKLIIGAAKEALIDKEDILEDQLIIHISGNVDLDNVRGRHYPDYPANFGYMSYTTDFIDPMAVTDLHAAGLKVAEGMLQANSKRLKGLQYKKFLESKYPALAFNDSRLW